MLFFGDYDICCKITTLLNFHIQTTFDKD